MNGSYCRILVLCLRASDIISHLQTTLEAIPLPVFVYDLGQWACEAAERITFSMCFTNHNSSSVAAAGSAWMKDETHGF